MLSLFVFLFLGPLCFRCFALFCSSVWVRLWCFCKGGPSRLPTASTCATLLHLPEHPSMSVLREQLLQIVRSERGCDMSWMTRAAFQQYHAAPSLPMANLSWTAQGFASGVCFTHHVPQCEDNITQMLSRELSFHLFQDMFTLHSCFSCSFVRSFVCLFVRLFVRLFVCLIASCLGRSLACSLACFAWLFVCLFSWSRESFMFFCFAVLLLVCPCLLHCLSLIVWFMEPFVRFPSVPYWLEGRFPASFRIALWAYCISTLCLR